METGGRDVPQKKKEIKPAKPPLAKPPSDRISSPPCTWIFALLRDQLTALPRQWAEDEDRIDDRPYKRRLVEPNFETYREMARKRGVSQCVTKQHPERTLSHQAGK
jgi:hypothetical protein